MRLIDADLLAQDAFEVQTQEYGNIEVVGLDAIDSMVTIESTNLTPSDIADLRNELCLKCGRYKTAHEGSCDSCRWKLNGE